MELREERHVLEGKGLDFGGIIGAWIGPAIEDMDVSRIAACLEQSGLDGMFGGIFGGNENNVLRASGGQGGFPFLVRQRKATTITGGKLDG